MPSATPHSLCFPESFSRTSPALRDPADPWSDGHASREMTPPDVDEAESFVFPMRDRAHDDAMRGSDDDDDERICASAPPPRTPPPTRRSVMKLENILNEVSIGSSASYLRSRSFCGSPRPPLPDVPFESVIFPVKMTMTRSVSPVDRVVKKKKVKMHKCPECQKEFPRPSGLRTHMNMHTKEKPFACTYPNCKRSFSVVSNAKRHMRTHGVGVRIEDHSSEASGAVPYVVGFEAPVVVSPPADHEADVREPMKLRWVAAPTAGSGSGSGFGSCSGSGSGSGTPSTASSRARSLSGVGSLDQLGPMVNDWKSSGGYSTTTSSEMDSGYSEEVEVDSPPWRDRECFSDPSSPRSYGVMDEWFGHRRVESERSGRAAVNTGVRYLESNNLSRPHLTD